MNKYTLIAGVNDTRKTSLRGVLDGEGCFLGKIVDVDLLAKEKQISTIEAGKRAINLI